MAKRQTIGNNPLDALLGMQETSERPVSERRKLTKERLTVLISEELLERMRNAVYWTPGTTLASIAEQGIALAIDKLERDRKAKFQPRRGEIKTGRPVC